MVVCCGLHAKAQSALRIVKRSIPSEHKITVIDSTAEHIWVGTTKGVYVISKKRLRIRYNALSKTGYSANVVTSLYCLEDGCVWIGSNNGLIKYDNYGFIIFNTENTNLPDNCILKIKPGEGNGLYILTSKNGIMRMHKNHFHYDSLNVKADALQSVLAEAK